MCLISAFGPVGQHFSMKRVDVDTAFPQHDQPIVTLQYRAVRSSAHGTGLSRAKRLDEISPNAP